MSTGDDTSTVAPAPETRAPAEGRFKPTEPGAGRARGPDLTIRLVLSTLRLLATALVLVAAAVAVLLIWDYYVVAPWTRDGRVRVQVASVAPQVSGQITEVRVVDDQSVREGDVLYVIDRFDYQNALDQAVAQVKQAAADYQVKRVQAQRRQRLSDLATSPEQQQQFQGSATQAEATFSLAQARQTLAEINLARTEVRSPVNGFVTNLQMRVGDYARAGTANLSIIDAASYWVDGYFEETKMARVCVGDSAEARLMGYPEPILGIVQSVARGIAVSDAAASTQGLPNVDPIYTWVRLAQRVPVRIRITNVPLGVPLVSGMTVTVSVRDRVQDTRGPWWRRMRELGERLTALYAPAPVRPGCIPAEGSREGHTVAIATPKPSPTKSLAELRLGLADGMTTMPRSR